MTTKTDPSSATAAQRNEKAMALALHLAHSENALRAFTTGQVDAVIDPEGKAYLLRPAQEHLQQNERRLQSIVENVADALMVVNRGGQILSQSPAARRVLGCEPEELEGTRIFDHVHESDLPWVYLTFFDVIEGFRENATARFRCRAGDSSYRLVEATVGRLRHSSSANVVFSLRPTALVTLPPGSGLLAAPDEGGQQTEAGRSKLDATLVVARQALRRGEEEIKAARDYAEATIRTMPVPFLILRPDLRVNSASELFYENFQVTPEETEGRLIYELGNRQWDIPKLRELLEEILPETASFIGYQVTHDFNALGRRTMLLNARRLDSDAGTPERIVLAIEDITARYEAEAAVRESEERYRALFEAVPVAVFVCDRAAVIKQYNQRAAELWGREPICGIESCSGSARIFLPDGTALPDGQNPILEVLRTGKSVLNFEILIERPDGSRLPALVNYAALKNADGKVTGAVTSFVDITERRRAEERARAGMVEIERASHAKDDFLAALSHELRTPLTPVLMTARALESDPALSLEVREHLAMMCRNIELEARLIDDLLDLTRISRGKLQIAPVATDLHHLLDHTAEIVRSDGLGKQVRVVFMLEAVRHHAMADPTRLQQVFWNLIKNALKFTPTGGTITVRTRNDHEGWIIVSVEDTGIGMAKEALPHIFKAFEQGDIAGQHRYGGLGLGLAIARAIVEVHGGMIHAESAGLGCGARFVVALASVDPPDAPTRGSVPRAASARVLRLLIVEDHEATRTVLTRLLTRNGHQVVTAATVQEALSAFVAHRFDAVVSDLGLPDGSGLDLMREIQRVRPVPAIALSGYGMEEDLRQTKEAGYFAHLVKPVNFDQLRLLLDQIPDSLHDGEGAAGDSMPPG